MGYHQGREGLEPRRIAYRIGPHLAIMARLASSAEASS